MIFETFLWCCFGLYIGFIISGNIYLIAHVLINSYVWKLLFFAQLFLVGIWAHMSYSIHQSPEVSKQDLHPASLINGSLLAVILSLGRLLVPVAFLTILTLKNAGYLGHLFQNLSVIYDELLAISISNLQFRPFDMLGPQAQMNIGWMKSWHQFVIFLLAFLQAAWWIILPWTWGYYWAMVTHKKKWQYFLIYACWLLLPVILYIVTPSRNNPLQFLSLPGLPVRGPEPVRIQSPEVIITMLLAGISGTIIMIFFYLRSIAGLRRRATS